MSAAIPSIEPVSLIAGDTVAWTKDISDYPAGTWTLKYYLRGPANQTITATQSGTSSTHAVSVTAATTAGWASGLYQWQAVVTSGAERHSVGSGEITVKENPISALTFETRSINKQILDALEATQLALAGRKEKSYSIEAAGRTHNFYSHEELILAIEKFRGWVKQEEDAKKVLRGEGTGKNILVRFN